MTSEHDEVAANMRINLASILTHDDALKHCPPADEIGWQVRQNLAEALLHRAHAFRRHCDRIVANEVRALVSTLVSTLAGSYTCHNVARQPALKDIDALADRAFELASSVPDYEAAAIEHDPNFALYQTADGVWRWRGEYEDDCRDNASREIAAEEFCLTAGIDPIEREVFEHWIVSDWLAEKLAARGEKVDTDFAGLTVWARTTTGQGIASDSVIQDIVADLVAPESDA